MLAIDVHLLRDCYVATAPEARSAAEWPPAPARLFSAMVAEWGALEAYVRDDERAERDDERAALRWLEQQHAPDIVASPDYTERTSLISFVPTNDKFDGEHIPHEAKERRYPTVLPRLPRVTFAWEDIEAPKQHQAALSRLLARVTRLGHSSSLVSCVFRTKVDETLPPVWLRPCDETQLGRQIRWVAPGQTDRLVADYEEHKGVRPMRVMPTRWCTYVEAHTSSGPAEVWKPSTAGQMVVFQMSDRPSVSAVLSLAGALRGGVLSHAKSARHPQISGHEADGSVASTPHLLFTVLPDLGREHASGSVLGLAVVVPDEISDETKRVAERAILAWEQASGETSAGTPPALDFTVNGRTVKGVRRLTSSEGRPFGLRSSTWIGRSRHWVSATPVVLPRHPGKLTARKATPAARAKAWQRAAEIVAETCEHVNLPRPADVQVSFSPMLIGAGDGHAYPKFYPDEERKPGHRLIHLHTALTFDEEVCGPLLLGAGRYKGMGLMRPVREPNERVT